MAQFPSQSSASGLWSLKKQKRAEQGDNWPPLFGPADDYFEYVTMLLPGNGTNGAQNNTFLDSSTNNFTITRNGNTTQGTFTPYGANWSNYFDGVNNQYISAPNNTALSLPSGTAFTIEAWIFPTRPNNGAQSGFRNIISKRVSNSLTSNYNIMLWFNSEKLGFFNGSTSSLSAANIPQNTWTHFAYVYDGGTSLKLYINGILDTNFSTTPGATNSADVWIGSLIDDTGTYDNFGGYISNARIVKGSQVYTSNFTPSTSPLTAITNTSLLTCQSNRFIDNSTNAFTITRNGDTSVQRFSPFNPTAPYAAGTDGGSGYFDGSGDYLSAGTNAAFAVGTGDFTIEFWVYPTAFSGTYTGYFTTRTGGQGFDIQILNSSATLMLGNSTGAIISANNVLSLNTWQHVCAVRSGTTNSLYVNGTRVATGTDSTNFTDNGAKVGSSGPSGGNNCAGFISDVRLVKGTAVYSPSSSTLTVPTAPLTAITNTSLLCNFTNAGIIDNAEMNNLETVGNAQISTSVSKFGGGSLAFDGTGDYLTTYGTPQFAFGAGDFTIECWVYFNSLTQYDCIIDFRPSGTNGAYPCIFVDTSNTLVYYVGGANRITSSAVSTGQWYHLAVSRTGTSTKMFLNGVQTGSTYTDSNSYLVGNPLTIGGLGYNSPGTYALDGYIDDLRITKGYARYTANFTPPAAPFPTY
jgi:hypothetical protein